MTLHNHRSDPISPAHSEPHPPFVVEEHSLSRVLQQRAFFLYQYVQKKIPQNMQSLITPEDILQEVWIGTFRRMSQVTGLDAERLDRWLQCLANRKLVSAIRTFGSVKRGGGQKPLRQHQDQAKSFVDLFALVASPQRTPSSLAAARELAHEVQIAIAQLPRLSRSAILMYHVQGLELEDIAKELGRSKDSVRGLLFRGRNRLGEILQSQSKFRNQ